MIKKSFPPIIDHQSKTLILGTMPGEKSLEVGQYYANPQNQFWKLISCVTGENLNVSYDEKKRLLLKHKIAIWDVLMNCEREGSLDIAIQNEYPNDFSAFWEKYPSIEVVCFNGNKAYDLFNRFIKKNEKKTYIILPSSSSANTSKSFKDKAQIWEKLVSIYYE